MRRGQFGGRPSTIHMQRLLQVDRILIEEVREQKAYLESMIAFHKEKIRILEGSGARKLREETQEMLRHDIVALRLVDAILVQFETGHIINVVI